MLFNGIIRNVLILSLIFIIFSCEKQLEVITQNDTYTKNDLVYKKGNNKPFTGIIKIVNEDSHTLSNFDEDIIPYLTEIEYENGIKNGKYFEYYVNGNKKLEGYFKQGNKYDDWTEFLPDGGKYKTYHYNTKGNLHGNLKHYFKDGTVYISEYYENGKLEGESLTYHESGDLIRKTNYKNGKKNGESILYYPETGKIHKEEYYFNGKRHGVFCEFDSSGNLVELEPYLLYRKKLMYSNRKSYMNLSRFYNMSKINSNSLLLCGAISRGSSSITQLQTSYYLSKVDFSLNELWTENNEISNLYYKNTDGAYSSLVNDNGNVIVFGYRMVWHEYRSEKYLLILEYNKNNQKINEKTIKVDIDISSDGMSSKFVYSPDVGYIGLLGFVRDGTFKKIIKINKNFRLEWSKSFSNATDISLIKGKIYVSNANSIYKIDKNGEYKKVLTLNSQHILKIFEYENNIYILGIENTKLSLYKLKNLVITSKITYDINLDSEMFLGNLKKKIFYSLSFTDDGNLLFSLNSSEQNFISLLTIDGRVLWQKSISNTKTQILKDNLFAVLNKTYLLIYERSFEKYYLNGRAVSQEKYIKETGYVFKNKNIDSNSTKAKTVDQSSAKNESLSRNTSAKNKREVREKHIVGNKISYLYSSDFKNISLKSKAGLRILRNTIYARHGHSFNSPDLRRYFAKKSWYKEIPGHKVSREELTEQEYKMIEKIKKIEKTK